MAVHGRLVPGRGWPEGTGVGKLSCHVGGEQERIGLGQVDGRVDAALLQQKEVLNLLLDCLLLLLKSCL